MQVRCPPLSQQLIDYLEAVFPDRVPDPARDDPKVRFGQVTVTRHLRQVLAEQEQSIHGDD